MYCTINNPLYAWSTAKNVAVSIPNQYFYFQYKFLTLYRSGNSKDKKFK